MAVTELDRLPRLPVLYARAAARSLPGRRAPGDRLPGTGYLYRGATVDTARLARYARVCGFRVGQTLPATYPHLLAFPLALRLMTDPEFPFPATGVVHLANRITVHRPLPLSELWDLEVHAERLRSHPRGRQVDLVAVATVDGVEVWRDVSTYLHRESGTGTVQRPEQPAPPAAVALWRVAPADARAYAAVSGDRNPIHTSTLAARAAGFRGRIAHGMWTKARCLAQLSGRLPDAYTVEVEFQAPLLLASTVGFSASRAGEGWRFAVHHRGTGRQHLRGQVRPPAPAVARPGPEDAPA